MYGDRLWNCMRLIYINNRHCEDNMESVKFRDRASAVNKMLNLLSYNHVKYERNIGKDIFLNHSKDVDKYGKILTKR